MALSELDMMNLWAKQLTGYKSQWERLFDFGYAIEAEVHKQDTELIRQMRDALTAPVEGGALHALHMAAIAIAAASARLEGKP